MPILEELATSFKDAKVWAKFSRVGMWLREPYTPIGMTFPDSSLEAIVGNPGILKNWHHQKFLMKPSQQWWNTRIFLVAAKPRSWVIPILFSWSDWLGAWFTHSWTHRKFSGRTSWWKLGRTASHTIRRIQARDASGPSWLLGVPETYSKEHT